MQDSVFFAHLTLPQKTSPQADSECSSGGKGGEGGTGFVDYRVSPRKHFTIVPVPPYAAADWRMTNFLFCDYEAE